MTRAELDENVEVFTKCVRKMEKIMTQIADVVSPSDVMEFGTVFYTIKEKLENEGRFTPEEMREEFKKTDLYRRINLD